jgi:hypothetical protein
MLYDRAFPVIDSITVTTLPIAVCAYMMVRRCLLETWLLAMDCNEEIGIIVVSAW